MRAPKDLLKIAIVFLLVLSSMSCARVKTLRENIASVTAKNLKNYSFDPRSPVLSRIQKVPDYVLRYLKEMDNDSTYSAYAPTEEENVLIADYIGKLPPLHKKVMQERLVGIYFVQNFQGSGMADYLLDEKDDVYTILILNPDVLKNDISGRLTYRENSCFIKNSPDFRIEVDSGEAFKGLMYILLHETTHIVDYIKNYTPYVEEELRELKQIKTRSTDFVKGIWTGYSKAVEQYDYMLRDKVTFYGWNKGPKINISDALGLYRQMSDRPFASLYGSQSWAEDFAEFVTFYHLTQKLKQPYEIRYYKGQELIFRYAPMSAPKVMERSATIQGIY